jgi:hypothetical protein
MDLHITSQKIKNKDCKFNEMPVLNWIVSLIAIAVSFNYSVGYPMIFRVLFAFFAGIFGALYLVLFLIFRSGEIKM